MSQARLPIVILAEAEAEALAAYDWYKEHVSAEVADGFRSSMRSTIERVAERPEVYAKFEGEVRRCQFARYPYAVLYEVNEVTIIVVAVMHLKRRPGYWKAR